jgi:DNA-binding PadR family transcriptional regulator
MQLLRMEPARMPTPKAPAGRPASPAEALTPAVFHILLALVDGERHGYAIMQDVAERTDGRVRLGPGTLYGTIRRLIDAGLIEESADRPVPDADDERRRYYRVTKAGRRAAEAESLRLAGLVRIASEKGLLPRRGR